MYKSHGKEYIENNFTQAELAALVKSAPSPPTTMTSPPAQRAGPLSSKKIVPQAPLEFNCKMCGSKFLTKNKLMQHMQSHGVVLIPCPTCGDKFMSQIELKEHKAKLHPVKKRKPGPASKTNAPPECRGITSLPTYLQLTQVSRRSSACSEVNKPAQQAAQATEAGAALTALISQLASAAAAKAPNERQACNFCTMVCKNPADLSQHLMNDHFKGLITPPSAASTPAAKAPQFSKTKEIRRTLGLDSSPPYRRPGPKRARLYKDSEGTLSASVPLPSNAVLSSSSVFVSKVPNLRAVCLSNSSSLSVPGAPPPSSGVPVSPVKFSKPSYTQVVTPMEVEENNNNNSDTTNNNNNNIDDSMLAHANLLLNLSMKPRKKSECPVCGILLSPKTNVNVHLRTHSGVRPYECVLCLNRFRQKAHLMKHFRCTHNQKQPPHICLFCSLETATSNDLYRHITDAHQKETDELRPSLLAARSDAAAAAAKEKSEQAELKAEEEEEEAAITETHVEVVDDEDIRYEPITEDFMYEDMVISPCYVVLPYVTEEEVDAAMYPPDVSSRS